MKELSVFIDESGDFGEYSPHSPYYFITMVFHNQDTSINEALDHLEQELSYLSLTDHCIHTGPIIRKEENYALWLHSSDKLTSGINAFPLRKNICGISLNQPENFPN